MSDEKKDTPPPCARCGNPSTGPDRNVGGAMLFTCSTVCCVEIEKAIGEQDGCEITDARALASIKTRHEAIVDPQREMAIGDGWDAHDDRGELLEMIEAASAALTAAGIHDDGRSLAERVALFRREADASSEVAERALREREQGARYVVGYREQVDRLRASLDSEKITKAPALRDLGILRRAAIAAVVTMGGKVPDDAGPEAIAAALRRGTKPAAPHEASTYSVTSEAFRADRAGTLREAARRGGVTITDEHGHTHCHIYTGPPPEPVEAHPRFCACHECDAVGW